MCVNPKSPPTSQINQLSSLPSCRVQAPAGYDFNWAQLQRNEPAGPALHARLLGSAVTASPATDSAVQRTLDDFLAPPNGIDTSRHLGTTPTPATGPTASLGWPAASGGLEELAVSWAPDTAFNRSIVGFEDDGELNLPVLDSWELTQLATSSFDPFVPYQCDNFLLGVDSGEYNSAVQGFPSFLTAADTAVVPTLGASSTTEQSVELAAASLPTPESNRRPRSQNIDLKRPRGPKPLRSRPVPASATLTGRVESKRKCYNKVERVQTGLTRKMHGCIRCRMT